MLERVAISFSKGTSQPTYWHKCQGLFWDSEFYSIKLFKFMSVLYWLLYFLVSFKIRKYEFFNFVLLKDVFGYSESLVILYEFYDQLFNFCKKGTWILIGFALTL